MLSLICLAAVIAVVFLSLSAFWPQLAMMGAGALYGSYEEKRERKRSRKLARRYEAAQAEARRANEDRYGQIMRGHESMYTRGMKGVGTLHEEEREAIEGGAAEARAGIGQDAVSRGLTGTTILPTLRAGVESDRVAELASLGGRTARRRGMYEQALTQPKLGFMERRTDAYPDMGEMASISGMRGQGGSIGRTLMEQLPMLWATRSNQQPMRGYGDRYTWPGSRSPSGSRPRRSSMYGARI